MVGTLAIWIGWDIYALVAGGAQATESRVISDASQVIEALAWAGGAAAGHFWVHRDEPAIARPYNYYALAVVGMLALLLSIASEFPTSAALGAGIVSGWLLWPIPKAPNRDG